MRKLRDIRHEKPAFDARFYERSPLFAPIARAASVFANETDWPAPARYVDAFEGTPVVTFEEQITSKPKTERYDAAIVNRRVVPSRARSWHDYLNALVWASFPIAKMALHTRQNAAIENWIPPGATRLPNARTRELDALALVDEGGILSLRDGVQWVFGHALFEGAVLDNRSMIARGIVLDATVETCDAALASFVRDTLQTPDDLPRAPILSFLQEDPE